MDITREEFMELKEGDHIVLENRTFELCSVNHYSDGPRFYLTEDTPYLRNLQKLYHEKRREDTQPYYEHTFIHVRDIHGKAVHPKAELFALLESGEYKIS